MIVLILLFCGSIAGEPIPRNDDSNVPGGFTPFKPTKTRAGDKPWWGPARSSSATQYPELRSKLYQGDILLPGNVDSRNAIKIKKYLWPNGTIPYKFAPNFTEVEEGMIRDAMKVIQSRLTSCIRFVPYEKHVEHIEFRKVPNKGCYAMIGRRPGKKDALPMNLQSPECYANRGIIEHELLHVLGLLHEQARPDRDDHVIIHWENIDSAYWSDFAKARTKDVATFGLPYDYKSIMHYPKWAFSKNGKSTITAKGNSKMELGQRDGPTEIDVGKIRKMYRCKN